MTISSIISICLILAGAFVMTVSIFFGLRSYRFLKNMDGREAKTLHSFNMVHHGLMFFFLLGYLAVVTAIITRTEVIGDLFVGLIFLFGAIFVFLGVRLQAAMSSMLRQRYDMAADALNALGLEREKLVEANSRLESEVVERQQAERRARERESRIEQILAGLPIGVMMIDARSLAIREVNPAAVAMIGLAREEIVGRSCHVFICEASKKSCPMQVGGRQAYQGEHLLACGNGRELPVLKTVSRVELEGRLHFLEAFINISEKKELEEKLQRSRRMEVIGTLAGSVAHDLNNILSGVINYPELMLMNLDADDPLRKPLNAIKNSGQRAAVIVQDLLTLARQNVAVKEVVNLAEVVNDYLNSPECGHLRARHPEVEILLREDEASLLIEGSPVHLGKMVMNLVANAAEAITRVGEVELSLEKRYLEAPLPGYDAVVEGEYALLTVRDNGVGIAPENLKKIFEPFYTSKVLGQSGSGLGMPVVRSTVQEHDGYIKVASVEGAGTRFQLFFPLTAKEAKREENRLEGELPRGDGQTVLVVDDLEIQREIAESLLTTLGYDAELVRSGEEALMVLDTLKFDLILLDMIMDPGMDGLETYRQILKKHPDQKVMLVSGYADVNRVKQMRQLGLDSHIHKPYTLQGLAENVYEVMHRGPGGA